jgi:hypothetical protein
MTWDCVRALRPPPRFIPQGRPKTTPLRLQLGGDAADAVRSHAETLLADLDKWERVSRRTSFAPQPA